MTMNQPTPGDVDRPAAPPGTTETARAGDATADAIGVPDEEARRRFEAAWIDGRPAPIEQFVPPGPPGANLATLEELVHIELEFAWDRYARAAGPTPPPRPDALEQYLQRFPALARPDILGRLVHQEIDVRRAAGAPPGLEEYRARFPVCDGLVLAAAFAGDGVTVTTTETGSAEEGWRALLAPPRAPGELGWLGPYRVEQLLGSGGMGVVFAAEDPRLGRRIALKVLWPAEAIRPGAAERFLREARLAAGLEHDHIVPVYHVGEDRGIPFVVMPLLRGESLDRRLRREGRLEPAEAARLAREALRGLAAAHAAGIVHRDVKPANLWLEQDGRVKVLDFGLARPAQGDSTLTTPGMVVGSPAYMAPEQAAGAPVDARADLFAVGCVLYQMTTGEKPFARSSVLATLHALATHQPPPPAAVHPAVPAELSRLIVRLLAKRPEDRPADATAAADALAVLEERLRRPARRRRRAWLVAGLVAIGLVTAAVIFIPTPRGTLVIDGADDDFAIVVKRDGAIIRDRLRPGEEVELRVGEYGLEIVRGKEGLRLSVPSVTIRRGERTPVKVYLEPAKTSAQPAPERDLERRLVTLAIRGGGHAAVTAGGEHLEIDRLEQLPDGPLSVIALSFRHPLGEAELRDLDELPQLMILDLDRVPAGRALLTRLAAARFAPWLRCFTIYHPDFHDDALDALGDFPRLDTVRCLGTAITDDGLRTLRRLPHLSDVNFWSCSRLTDSGLAHLRGLKLRTINLFGIRGITDEGLRHLGAITGLRHLDIAGTSVSDAGLAHLHGLAKLQLLAVQHTRVGDSGLASIARLTDLEVLWLDGTAVTSAGLRQLAALRRLRDLHLAGTAIDDSAIEPLQALTGLGSLDLSNTTVTAPGLARLRKALPQCKIQATPTP